MNPDGTKLRLEIGTKRHAAWHIQDELRWKSELAAASKSSQIVDTSMFDFKHCTFMTGS